MTAPQHDAGGARSRTAGLVLAAALGASGGAHAADPAAAPASDPAGTPEVAAPAAWWQFDRNRFTADETDTTDLVGLPLPAMRSPQDIELVFRVVAAPALAASLSVEESASPEHWSAATGTGGMTLAALINVVPPAAGGASQWMASRWDEQTQEGWRLMVVPTGPGTATLRADIGTTAGVVGLERAAPTDAWTWLLLTIDPARTMATMELRDDDGAVVDVVTTPLPASVGSAATPMTVGREPGGATGDVEVQLDVVAGWSSVLDATTRAALVDADGPVRFVEFSGWPGLAAPMLHPERVAGWLQGDRRHVVMGDSFAFAAGWNRVLPALLRVSRFGPFTGVAAGVRSPHTLISTTPRFSDSGPANPRAIVQGTQYRCEWTNGTAAVDAYGLPLNQLMELRANPGATVPADGSLLQFTVANAGMSGGVTGPLSRPGDAVAFRVVHRRTSAAVDPIETLRLTDEADAVSVDVDLLVGEPRQAATSSHQLVVTTGADGNARAVLREATPGAFAAGPERFAGLAGVMAWRVDATGARIPGQYYTSLHDGSWSWPDFGRDQESGVPGPLKSISREQLVRWLEATTLDPAQPLGFWWYVDTEDRSEASTGEFMRAAIDLADDACAVAGLPRPVHLLVVPHLHQTEGRTRDQLWSIFARYRGAADGIALDPAYDHVARMSIFDATDGMTFDGRIESVEWLAARGYDQFTFGDATVDLVGAGSLLDDFDAHPRSPVAAAFFASFLGAAIPEAAGPPACPADVDADGSVGFTDVLSVLAAWGPCPNCPADVDGDGTAGFGDVLAVLAAWGPCPKE